MATADDCRSEALITAPLHRVFVLLLPLSVARPLLLLLAISLQAKGNRGLATFRKHWFFLPWLARRVVRRALRSGPHLGSIPRL